ncbi:MAG: glucosaminidase domain-containing protein [Phaeodactylibacter sp.]|nr:glucosaminidase domain-containing protein [Phaeodactylibacter sp.]
MISRFVKPLLAVFLACLFTTLTFSQISYQNLNTSNQYLLQNLPASVLQYVDKYLPVASEVAHEYNVPVDFLLSVAGLETGWGQSELSQMANNHFGIKNFYNEGPSYCMMHMDYNEYGQEVVEQTCFKKYASPKQSFVDYLEHLESRGCYLDIKDIPKATFADWIRVVAECGYATDPSYAQKVANIRVKYYFDRIIPSMYR